MEIVNGKLLFSSGDIISIRIDSLDLNNKNKIILKALESHKKHRCKLCYFSLFCNSNLSLHCIKTYFLEVKNKDKE